MKTSIYYFTGTGNSLKIARDLSLKLENVELVQIRQERLEEQLYSDSDVIGFIVPTIFSGIPKLVERFIRHLNVANQAPYIFTIATHGDKNGMGIVFEQMEKLLLEKKLSLSACFAIQMPHNMPQKDHVTTTEKKEFLFKEETIRISEIAEAIQKCKSIPYVVNKIKSFFERMTYNSMNNFTKKNPLDKGFYVDEKCSGCNSCEKVCPANNIEMSNNKPKWKLENCQFCFACVQWCPTEAIQYKKGTIGVKRYHHPEVKINDLISKE